MISFKQLSCLAALSSLSLLLGAACGTTGAGNPLTSSAGSGSTGGTGIASGGGVTAGSSASAGGGGDCKVGGTACDAFDECCSGVCSNQSCTTCGNDGEACGEGCCVGLTCYGGRCGACTNDGLSCALASDCCSNECNQGLCAHCGGPGEECLEASECCAGLTCGADSRCCAKEGGWCNAHSDCCDGASCANGVCTPCNGPTCKDASIGTGDPDALCGPARDDYDALKACNCTGACGAKCAQTFCVGMAPPDACVECLFDDVIGCGKELAACQKH